MNIENVKKYLDDYVVMPNPQYAVMLKGQWGCGKTYFVKKLIHEWSSKETPNKNAIYLKPIYVSLNGLSSVQQISYSIKRVLCPILYSKGAKIVKKVVLSTMNLVAKNAFDIWGDNKKDDISSVLDSEAILEILQESNDAVKGNKIIVFDDLERCRIAVDEIFGYINNLVEHSQCKVIIIGEEDKIREQDDKDEGKIPYKDFKEKLIGQSFIIQQDFDEIIKKFAKDIENDHIINNIDVAIELFKASGIDNLRIIKRCFLDFCRLCNMIDLSNYETDLAEYFRKNVFAYFIITYCEHKSGNTGIAAWQSSSSIASLIRQEKQDENIAACNSKYNKLLNRHNIVNSFESMGIERIVEYIDNGIIQNLPNVISSSRMLMKQELQDWEILWEYVVLDNETFSSKLESVRETFYNGEIDFISVVLHISGMLLNYVRLELCNDTTATIVETAKGHIDTICEKETDSKKIYSSMKDGSWGKQWQGSDIPEMKQLITYARQKGQESLSVFDNQYCRIFWESLTDDKVDNITDYFRTTIMSGQSSYEFISIFKDVDPIKTAAGILSVSNKSKDDLKWFLKGRYYLDGSGMQGSIGDCHLQDLEVLKRIKSELSQKVSTLQLIDKWSVTELIKVLEECESKLSAKLS